MRRELGAEHGCSKCRYSLHGCARCRAPGFHERQRAKRQKLCTQVSFCGLHWAWMFGRASKSVLPTLWIIFCSSRQEGLQEEERRDFLPLKRPPPDAKGSQDPQAPQSPPPRKFRRTLLSQEDGGGEAKGPARRLPTRPRQEDEEGEDESLRPPTKFAKVDPLQRDTNGDGSPVPVEEGGPPSPSLSFMEQLERGMSLKRPRSAEGAGLAAAFSPPSAKKQAKVGGSWMSL